MLNTDLYTRLSKSQFDDLFRKHYRDLYAYGLYLTHDQALVEDIIQAVFLGLWEKRHQQRSVEYWMPYLKRIFYRKLMLEQKHQRKTLLQATEAFSVIPSGPTVEDLWIERQLFSQQLEELAQAIDHLPNQERQVLLLRFKEGLSYEEIASAKGKSKQTIYNQVFSAVRRLKLVFQSVKTLVLIYFLFF